MTDPDRLQWFYVDRTGQEFGPFRTTKMRSWFSQGFFPIGDELLVRLGEWPPESHVPVKILYPEPDSIFVGGPQSPFSAVRQPRRRSRERRRSRSRERREEPPSRGRMEDYPMDYDRPPPPGYGPPPPAYGPGYGPPPGYGAYGPPPYGTPGYGPPPPGYGPPPPGYGPPPPGYGPPPFGYGAPPGYGPGYGPPGGPPGYGPPGHGGPSGPGSGRYSGTLKSFNAKGGFGFIDCPEVRHRYTRDVYVHKAQIGDLQVGEELNFLVDTNKDGYPQARDIRRRDGSRPGQKRGGDGDDANGWRT
eukprot:s340_g21.t1